MWARTTTIRGNPRATDRLIAYVRDDVLHECEEHEGFVGLSMLADRRSGRCVVTTAWLTLAALNTSTGTLAHTRERGGEILGGVPEVLRWELALVHRVHEAEPSACTRVIMGEQAPDRLDRTLELFRTDVLPELEQLPGFASTSIVQERTSGRMATAVTYDSREQLAQAGDRARRLREDFSRASGLAITEVAEFDLVLAHLRVPETV
jgi:heme-degrading monooxygenase HmoA